jgi:serine/threonine-protein kinase
MKSRDMADATAATSPTAATRLCPECDLRTSELRCPTCRSETIPATALGSKDEDLIGTLIGDKYEVKSILGKGGMGVVYKAVQLSMDRPVAIKLIKTGAQNVELLKRFQREAKITSKLAHPNIISIYDYGVTDEGPYLVMEYLEGNSVEEELEKHGAIELKRAVYIVVQALRALDEAHRIGVVHRDLKPDNLFLTRRGSDQELVKILDFGVAKTLYGETKVTQLTSTGSVVGTLAYMAPEQFDMLEVDARADIYSMGITLFHMLTGNRPFQATSMVQLIKLHLEAPVPDVTGSFGKAAGTAVQSALEFMLAKRPEQRPESAAATAEMLEQMLAGHAPRRTTSGSIVPTRRSPLPLVLGSGVALGLLVGGYIWWSQDSAPAPTAVAEVARAPAPAPAKAPKEIRLKVDSAPNGKVFLDDRWVGDTPYSGRVPYGDKAVALTVQADGCKARKEDVVPSRDQELTITLDCPKTRATVRPKKSKGEDDPFSDF